MSVDEAERLREALIQITTPSEDWTRLITQSGINLTREEAITLHLLQNSAPEVVSIDAIMSATSWDRLPSRWAETNEAIYMKIKRLRRKIKDKGIGTIETIYGAGYRWVTSDKEV